MERSEAYWILHNMWGEANEEQREALSIAQRDIEFVDLMDDRFTPVKHGRWIEQEAPNMDTYYDCSACGESFCFIEGSPKDNLYTYCPNCGAKMYGGENDA